MPTVAANTVVIHEGKVLLTKREDFEVWCLPSGGVEEGESVAQAAIRETLEETGLVVELTGLVGVYSRVGVIPDIHAVVFTGKVVGGEIKTLPGETLEVKFFAPDEIPQALSFGHGQRIHDALAGLGGSVARLQLLQSATAQTLTRQEFYKLRDESGLPRAQFYMEFLAQHGAEEGLLQAGGGEGLSHSKPV